jgi:hypothetical protein
MLGAIQRDQHPTVQALERVEYSLCRDRFEEQRIERRRRRPVQHQPNIRIGRDGGHTEQGLAVRPAVPLLQRALMAQERGASHEKDREVREADVSHGVLAVVARSFAPVRKIGADSSQLSEQGLQGGHKACES